MLLGPRENFALMLPVAHVSISANHQHLVRKQIHQIAESAIQQRPGLRLRRIEQTACRASWPSTRLVIPHAGVMAAAEPTDVARCVKLHNNTDGAASCLRYDELDVGDAVSVTVSGPSTRGGQLWAGGLNVKAQASCQRDIPGHHVAVGWGCPHQHEWEGFVVRRVP